MPPKSKRAAKEYGPKGIERVPESWDVTLALDSCVRLLTKLGVGVPAEMKAVANSSRGYKRPSSSTVYLVQYAGASSQPREVRLRRLLAYGDELPAYMPGTWKSQLSQHYTIVILEYLYYADVCEKKPHPLHGKEPVTAKRQRPSSPAPVEKALEDMKREEWETTVKKHYPLLNILEEYLNPANGWPKREYAIYALAVCAQRFCNHYLKNGFYILAEKYLVSVDDLFYFIKIFTTRFGEPRSEVIPNAMEGDAASSDENLDENHDGTPAAKNGKKQPSIKKRRNRRGWGRGIRAVVQHWYEKQNAEALVKSVSRMKSHHGWKHADLVKMAHVCDTNLRARRKDCAKECRSEPSTPFSLALYFILQGYAKTKDLDVDQTLESVKKVILDEHIVDREKITPDVIRSKTLKVEELRLEKNEESDIWLALVENMTAADVLLHVDQLCSVDQNVNSDLWHAAAEKLKKLVEHDNKEIANINPSAVAIAMTNFVMAMKNDGKIVRKKVIKTPKEIDGYDTDKDEMFIALDNLLNKSLQVINPVKTKRVVAVLHLGGNEMDSPCAVSMSMSTKFAAALILLSLWYQYQNNFDVWVFKDANTVETAKFILPCTIHELMKHIEEKTEEYSKSKSGNARMAAAMSFAKERINEGVDAFVLITSSLRCWSPDSDVLTALQEYNDEKKPKVAKLAVWALSNTFINVSQLWPSLNTMDFAGFDAHSLFVLNKFISDAFVQKIDVITK
ncbi:RNA-binding protein RO60-like [Cloeon dipterum]|uniref:RNA-binding protein RO60-like n=1 Tax=Cloeon dipterum TaxID=197152 RepID=UPI0032203316